MRAMDAERIVLTYKEYEALPADGRRYEIHDGELSVTPAPTPRHQRVLANLFDVLRQHVNSRSLGEAFLSPLDVILDDTTIVQPDLVYLDPTRLGLVSDRGIEGPPTLVVEILSPTTTIIDRSTKHQLYRRYGVPYYWIVDPGARTLEAYVLDEGRYRLETRAFGSAPVSLPPFPELALVPAALWP
jgi:Uma2 family endonuclease